uniref:Uncharacterized protein n=1 Tax=Arundo donax TaxID=35708 RepID=A0A0A9GKA3_ARUDO
MRVTSSFYARYELFAPSFKLMVYVFLFLFF